MPLKKACIIGCGAIMPVHAGALEKLNGVGLTAVADIQKERADAAAARFHCRAYADWKEMLERERPDAVHLCTPHYLHAPMAVYALEHGINVLTEKPVALNAREAAQIAAARDASHKTAAVVFQNRLNDAVVAARRAVGSGNYGKLLGIKGIVAWHRDENYYTGSGWRGRFATEGGGVLMNQSIHTLDLMTYFAGVVKSVRAHVDTFVLDRVIEVEDTAEAVLFFESGARGLFFATTANLTDSPVEIEIVLEQAKIVLQGGEATITRGGKTERLCAPHDTESRYKGCWGTSHEKLIDLFYRGLDEGGAPFVGVEDGAYSLRVIDAIYRSSQSGAAERVLQ